MNPFSNYWQALTSSKKTISEQSTIHNDGHDAQRQQELPEPDVSLLHSSQQTRTTPLSRAVVFDTMVNDTWRQDSLRLKQHQRTITGNIRRQDTIRSDEEEEESSGRNYFIHSQQSSNSSWATSVRAFLQAGRTLEQDDNDALCWCE